MVTLLCIFTNLDPTSQSCFHLEPLTKFLTHAVSAPGQFWQHYVRDKQRDYALHPDDNWAGKYTRLGKSVSSPCQPSRLLRHLEKMWYQTVGALAWLHYPRTLRWKNPTAPTLLSPRVQSLLTLDLCWSAIQTCCWSHWRPKSSRRSHDVDCTRSVYCIYSHMHTTVYMHTIT